MAFLLACGGLGGGGCGVEPPPGVLVPASELPAGPSGGLAADAQGRAVWLPWKGSLLAITVGTSNDVTPVAALGSSLSSVQLSFFPGVHGLLLAHDASSACPGATASSECTAIERLDVAALAADAPSHEGAWLDDARLAPDGDVLALQSADGRGGLFTVGTAGDPQPLAWGVYPGAFLWGPCLAGCDERLFAFGDTGSERGVFSWPVIGGVIAPQPDLHFDPGCPLGGGDPGSISLAVSVDGRWLAASCGDGAAFDDLSGVAPVDRVQKRPGPVMALPDLDAFYFADQGGDPDKDGDDDRSACFRVVDPETRDEKLQCTGLFGTLGYYASSGPVIVIDESGPYPARAFAFDVEQGLLAQLGTLDFGFSGSEVVPFGPGGVLLVANGELEVVEASYDAAYTVAFPFRVQDVAVLPNDLALLSTSSIVFVSYGTGTAGVPVPLP